VSTVIINNPQRRGPGCLISVLWYLFIGWWLSGLAVGLAWLCMLTVVGIPAGVAIINMLPKIVALREPGNSGLQVVVVGNTTVIGEAAVKQHNILVRALYFLLIGFWFSALWMSLAWLACATIIGMPLGFWMFDKTPFLLSLHRG